MRTLKARGNSAYEHEADQAARSLSPVPVPTPLRPMRTAQTVRSVHDVVQTPGVPLPGGMRREMESRFQHDFSGVRVHHDHKARQSAGDSERRAGSPSLPMATGRARNHRQPTTDGRGRIENCEL